MVADDTKARIRAVAMELFTAQGYEQTSLREIADRVGMTKASLYYHYPSKQALLLALIEPLVDEWRSEVEAAEREPYDAANVRISLGRILDTMIRHRDACAIVMRDTPALTSVKPILQQMMQVATRLHTWLAGPHPTDTDRIKAVAASEVLGGAVSSVVTIADISPVVLRQTLLDCAMGVLDLTPALAPEVPAPVGSQRVPVNQRA
ncbi:helix-turn-helix domain-containing protein [Phytohabitans sp. ZYX-F-186]|uniref:Helix-turn-helix domain-containing protein n=1 Tax=Phytohabitans maris TaxID=3071409 RepID=A0ABU0ZHC8_9ACTN|nr:helix-turn-helix domain-containing protein [Phytohabitans sp. ZYX-F-186]MDQ7906464.1 helix-turn-helix domain-containing protein [Phytohabitans sp. ZYX-F-186]